MHDLLRPPHTVTGMLVVCARGVELTRARDAPITKHPALYNSVLFATVSIDKYLAVLATEDFGRGGHLTPWDHPEYHDSPQQLRQDWASLARLDNKECLQAYGSANAGSGWGSVVVVSSLQNNSTVLGTWMHSPTYKSLANGNGWICDKDASETRHISASLLATTASWTIPDVNVLTYADNGT
ncbi:hypothetical protein LTR53_011758 [Teratosphaeriaceae sp. CCFEE 6253]|nr:hypothetical protein LTR53_011758 [Teratosphaeriaceae sp. CCFEE 6253]